LSAIVLLMLDVMPMPGHGGELVFRHRVAVYDEPRT